MTERPNRQILLVERPRGKLEESQFELIDSTIGDPGPGELLVRTILLSIDPANRAWMQGRTYREQLGAGEAMAGGALGEVVAANGGSNASGSLVQCEPGWQGNALVPVHRIFPWGLCGALS